MESAVTQLGIGGIFAILVIREVLGFLKGRKEVACYTNEDRKMLADLHDWHNRKDDDGVYVWYVRRSLEDAINSMADSQRQLAASISKLCEVERQQTEMLKETHRAIMMRSVQ